VIDWSLTYLSRVVVPVTEVAVIRWAFITSKEKDVYFAIKFKLDFGRIRSPIPAFPKAGAAAS
jgi:hypothetical protein